MIIMTRSFQPAVERAGGQPMQPIVTDMTCAFHAMCVLGMSMRLHVVPQTCNGLGQLAPCIKIGQKEIGGNAIAICACSGVACQYACHFVARVGGLPIPCASLCCLEVLEQP
jgi:hypothetical protein